MADGETRTRDGVRLSFTLREAGSGARVVLLHSLALDRSVWDGVVARLDGHASILTYDARGHGASDRPKGPYSVELFADDMAEVMDAAGWDSATIVGASMGGSVALAFAIRHPSRSSALGLIDTTAWYGPDARQNWEGRAQKAETDGFGALADFQATRWFSDGFRTQHPATVRQYLDRFLRGDIGAYGASCRMLGACDLRDGARSIAVPATIVVGEEDYATPVTMAQTLHDLIPRSTLTVIDGARHLTPIEVPDRIAAELERLLTTAAV